MFIRRMSLVTLHARYQHYYLVFAVLVFGIVLRLWRLTYVTLWSDEFSGTLQLIRLPWTNLLSGNYPWEFNPPLYFLVLKAWVEMLGATTENGMRMLSVLMSTVSMLAVYFLGKQLGDWRVGLGMMSILAFHPKFLYHATELRMYPLLIMLSSLAFLCYTKYTFENDHSKKWLLALGVTLVLGTYTHYFGGLTVLGIVIFALSMLIAKRDKTQYFVLWTVVLSGLFILPLTQILIEQYNRYIDKSTSQSLTYPTLSLLSIFSILSGNLSFDFKINEPLQWVSLLAALSGIVVSFGIGRKPIAIALVLFILLSWLVAFVISTRNINILPRYLIVISVISWLVISLSLVKTNDKIPAFLSIFAIITISANVLFGVYSTLNREYSAPDWRMIAQRILQEVRQDEQIVIMGWDAAPTGYYLNREWLTSYDLEKQLTEGAANRYLILDSRYSRKLDFIDYTKPTYESPEWQVKIIRYVPEKPAILLDE